MKFVFLSPTGALHGLAARCQSEGHEVRLAARAISDVPLSQSWRPDAKTADLVATDGRLAEASPHVLRSIARFSLGGPPEAYSVDADLGPQTLAFWNGIEFMQPFFRVEALHKMLSGDLGANLPYNAVAVHPVPALEHPALGELSEWLAALHYRGPVLLAGTQAVAMAEPGLLYAVLELFRRPIGLTLYDIAAGRSSHLAVWNEWAVALQLSSPPYPFSRLPGIHRPSISVVVGAAKHFWPADMSLKYEVAGGSGLLGYATARGRGGNLREAHRRLERVLQGINGTDLALQYRIDAVPALDARLSEMKNGE